ncbi:MAG TPA: YbaB/EbfC family nucleoid-associated protein [Candidatus Mailhella merdavium]|nr:YbaB/EbfC family nucleoid-associated protein [Candidatus Mailhella merdavium]
MPNMNDLLRQAQVMQNKVLKLQQEMAEKTVETSAGGGMVKVVMNGRQELRSIAIDPRALEGGDVEMLQDLIISAVNEGVRVTRSNMEREMTNLTGGIRVPGMF